MTLATFQVGASLSDGYCLDTMYTWDDTGAYYQLGRSTTDANGEGNPFVHFSSILIPPKAKIMSAILQVRAYDTRSGTTVIHTIKGEAADNPTAATSSNYWSKTRTTATVSWTVPIMTGGTWYDSSDISTIVQEIVDRSGWARGNAMQFFIEFTSSPNTTYRRISSYNEAAANATKLIVDYVDPGCQPAIFGVNGWM